MLRISSLALAVVISIISFILLVAAGGAHAHMFKSEFVEELTPETLGKFLSSHHAAYVAFYAPWCGHCKNLVSAWQSAAKSMKGTVKFGAIDVDKHKSVGSQFGIQGFPTIKKWGMGSKKGVQPTDYQGGRTAGAIQSDALSMIKSKTTLATTADQLVQAAAKTSLKKAFVLFTNKDKVAPLYNVLSYSPHYDGKMAFVVVKTQNKKTADLVSLFGNPKVPSMQVVSLNEAGDAVDTAATQEYTGAVEYKTIAKYLVDIVKGETPSSSSSSSTGDSDDASASNDEQQQKEKEAPKPPKRALPVTVTTLTNEAIADFCSGNAQGRKQPFCVVIFHSPESKGAVPEDVHKTFYSDSVLIFTAYAEGAESSAEGVAAFRAAKEAFGEGSPNTAASAAALVFRTTEKKITKYLWVDGNRNQDLETGISKILDGSSRMNKAGNSDVFKF